MNHKDLLIDWIHRVEINRGSGQYTKRLPSLVNELFFEKNKENYINYGRTETIVSGWSYRNVYPSDDRYWYSLKRRSSEIDVSEHKASNEFARLIKNKRPRDKIFNIHYDLIFKNKIPSINFRCIEVELINQTINFNKNNEAKEIEDSINSLCNKNIADIKSLHVTNYNSIHNWLNCASVTESEIELIFASRCFMNYSKLYLTDIDSIKYSPSTESFAFIEFKRKDPAQGSRRVPDISLKTNKLNVYLTLIRNGINEDTFKVWPEKKSQCFGLDASHANNVLLCQQLNIDYLYIIWNSSKRNLEEYLDYNLNPIYAPDLRYLKVVSDSFDGLSKTYGDKSGTYKSSKKNNIRYQLMIPEEFFSIL